MIVMCDIDNCLNDLIAKAVTLYNDRNNKDIQLSDITTYDLADCLPEDDADGIIKLFQEKELWDSLKPLPGAQDGLKKIIKQGHRVILATATDPINFMWKIEWLQKWFPFIPSENVIRIMDKSLIRCDVIIDDCLDNLTSNIAERICIDCVWNKSAHKDYAYDIHRVFKWNEIPNVINDIERTMKEWENQ